MYKKIEEIIAFISYNNMSASDSVACIIVVPFLVFMSPPRYLDIRDYRTLTQIHLGLLGESVLEFFEL